MFFKITLLVSFCALTFQVPAQKSKRNTPAHPKKIVVLTFDDGVKTHYSVVAPILTKYGFSATFFFCEFPDFFGDTTKYMSWENVRQLSKWGFDIGNHTWHHQNVGIPTARLEEELGYIERKCDSLGIPKPISFAYPGYSTAPSAIPVLKAHGYAFARTGNDRPYFPATDDPLLMPSFTPNDNAQSAISAINRANGDSIVIFTIHGVPDTVHPWVNTSIETFETYIKYLKDNHITVMSMRELQKYLRKRKLKYIPPK